MGFHSYLEAEAANLALILPGHYATERLGVLALAEWLSKEWPGLQVWASTQEQDPVHWA
jgi:putative NIF3 family GTP cyclohydrolase 1 type 2